MEQEPAEFYERVREAYRELAEREPKRIVLINGARKADEIENEIWEMLCSRFQVSPLATDCDGRNGETAKRRNGDESDPPFPRFGSLPKCARQPACAFIS